MERLSLDGRYEPVEMAIHAARYALALPFCKGRRVLDIACGEGYGAALMSRWGAATVTGVDIDEATVETCRSLFPSCRFVQCAAEEASAALASEQFDLIVSLETMEHVYDLEVYFDTLRRLRAPGGGIIISCPNDPWYNRARSASNEFHLRELDYNAFQATITDAFRGAEIQFHTGSVAAGFLSQPSEKRRYESFDRAIGALTEIDGIAVPPPEGNAGPDTDNVSYFVAFIDLPPAKPAFAGYQLPMEALSVIRDWKQFRERIHVLQEAQKQHRGRLEQVQGTVEACRQRIHVLQEARKQDRERLQQARGTVEAYRQRIHALQEARKQDRERLQQAQGTVEAYRQRIHALQEAQKQDRERREQAQGS